MRVEGGSNSRKKHQRILPQTRSFPCSGYVTYAVIAKLERQQTLLGACHDGTARTGTRKTHSDHANRTRCTTGPNTMRAFKSTICYLCRHPIPRPYWQRSRPTSLGTRDTPSLVATHTARAPAGHVQGSAHQSTVDQGSP
jgi:hypothetical protein